MRIFLAYMARQSGSFSSNFLEFKSLRYQLLEKRATFSDKTSIDFPIRPAYCSSKQFFQEE